MSREILPLVLSLPGKERALNTIDSGGKVLLTESVMGVVGGYWINIQSVMGVATLQKPVQTCCTPKTAESSD